MYEVFQGKSSRNITTNTNASVASYNSYSLIVLTSAIIVVKEFAQRSLWL